MSSCKTRDLPESENTGYGYYSKMLKQPFDKLEDLKAAEAKETERVKKEQEEQLARKADAEEVKNAFRHLLETKEKAAGMIKEAEQNYLKTRQSFINKYGSYHMTYCSDDGDQEITLAALINSIFADFRRML